MIIIDLIAFISYIIFEAGIVYYGDIQMIIGCVVGVRFSLKNIKPNQSFFKQSLKVSLGGLMLTGISLSLFDWIVFLSFSYFGLLIAIYAYFIEAIIIGLIVGFILGGYYNYTHKTQSESSSVEDEFYESLLEK